MLPVYWAYWDKNHQLCLEGNESLAVLLAERDPGVIVWMFDEQELCKHEETEMKSIMVGRWGYRRMQRREVCVWCEAVVSLW